MLSSHHYLPSKGSHDLDFKQRIISIVFILYISGIIYYMWGSGIFYSMFVRFNQMFCIAVFHSVSLGYSCPLWNIPPLNLFSFQSIYKWQPRSLVSPPRWVCTILGGLVIMTHKSLLAWVALDMCCGLMSWTNFLDTWRMTVNYFISTSSPDVSLSMTMQCLE